jgi:hypothetical protein
MGLCFFVSYSYWAPKIDNPLLLLSLEEKDLTEMQFLVLTKTLETVGTDS